MDEDSKSDGYAVRITEIDHTTAYSLGDVMLSVAYDMENQMVFIGISSMPGDSQLFTAEDIITGKSNQTLQMGQEGAGEIQRLFIMTIEEWVLFNSILSDALRKRLADKAEQLGITRYLGSEDDIPPTLFHRRHG